MSFFSLKNGECAIISDKINRAYLCDIAAAEGVIFLTGEKAYYYLDARYYGEYEKEIISFGFTPVLINGGDDIKDRIKGGGFSVLYMDFSSVTAKDYLFYSDGIEVKDLKEKIDAAREIKTADELSKIKIACEIAQEAYYIAIENLSVGMTEKELAEIIEESMILCGGEGASFDTIVAFGENSAVPHHLTGERTLKDGDIVLCDFGCFYKGYASDMTRTCVFGHAPDRFIDDYNAVLSANITAEENIAAGISGKSADAIARKILEKAGISEYFIHSLGHGVGREIHESPYLSPKSVDILKENSVFTVEPGIYKNGLYGIRIEDTVVIKNGKVERLFTDGKDLKIIKR